MIRKTILIAAFCSLVLAAYGQYPDVKSYIKARKVLPVQIAPPSYIFDREGKDMVFEVSANYDGFAGGANSGYTLLIKPDNSNETLFIHAAAIPNWMSNGNSHIRMLINVHPTGPATSPEMQLLKAIPESMISQWENDNAPKKVKYSQGVSKVVRGSRGGGRPISSETIGYTSTPRSTELSSRGSSRRVYTISEAFPFYAEFIAKVNKRLSIDEVNLITQTILEHCVANHVDARLIVALVIAESSFNPNATSRTGAKGLGQLMPRTARGMGVNNAYDPAQNLEAAIKIIAGHIRNYGGDPEAPSLESIKLSLAAYNAGAGAVKRYGGIPPYRETQNYVKRILRQYQALCDFQP